MRNQPGRHLTLAVVYCRLEMPPLLTLSCSCKGMSREKFVKVSNVKLYCWRYQANAVKLFLVAVGLKLGWDSKGRMGLNWNTGNGWVTPRLYTFGKHIELKRSVTSHDLIMSCRLQHQHCLEFRNCFEAKRKVLCVAWSFLTWRVSSFWGLQLWPCLKPSILK